MRHKNREQSGVYGMWWTMIPPKMHTQSFPHRHIGTEIHTPLATNENRQASRSVWTRGTERERQTHTQTTHRVQLSLGKISPVPNK